MKLSIIPIPASGYIHFNVQAIENHTYVSLGQQEDPESHIIFRVNHIEPDYSSVIIEYYYKTNPQQPPNPTPQDPDPIFEFSDFQEFLILALVTFGIIVALILLIGNKLIAKPGWSSKKNSSGKISI